MEPEIAIDLGRQAIKACLLIGGPILLVGLLVGLIVGLLQAMTQVQDQTVSIVPKILLIILVIALGLPWLAEQMTDYAKASFRNPIQHRTASTSDSGFDSTDQTNPPTSIRDATAQGNKDGDLK